MPIEIPGQPAPKATPEQVRELMFTVATNQVGYKCTSCSNIFDPYLHAPVIISLIYQAIPTPEGNIQVKSGPGLLCPMCHDNLNKKNRLGTLSVPQQQPNPNIVEMPKS